MYGLATRTASVIASSSSSARPLVAWLAKNYEDSIRRRHEMEQRAAQNDSTAKRLMRESEKIRKDLR